ncbi:acyltransferase family protein [Yersinia kristensenii]|uniref:acyltransferase family protein n=1 Tax=Yersinia kristensenii TaxID=28152 RepID=UPI001C6084BB|nr:acyltransferase [Yersinia kristensenii]MBW5814495.1 acyltransferase [Yersinia kristensenii]MBW5831629.1 acyltransferase [Yersinia kristensenii]
MNVINNFWAKWFKSYGDTDFITGMRAFAAIAVVLIHSGGAGLRDFGWYGNDLVNLGAIGPCIFFVISGYSVSVSYDKSSGFFSFLKKRILRIAPLYYFWIIVFVFLLQDVGYWGKEYGASLDLYNLAMHFSFLSFSDYKVANSILGVEWSLSVEVFWYIFVPVIITLMQSKKSIYIMLFVSWAALLLTIVILKHYLFPKSNDALIAYYWTPLPYLFSYCAGVAAFKIRSARTFSGRYADVVLLLSMAFILLYPVIDKYTSDYLINKYIVFSILTMIIISVGSNNSLLFRVFLFNRVSVFLGAISYSLYLSHSAVIQFADPLMTEYITNSLVRFITVLSLSIILSVFTYVLIEKILTNKIRILIDFKSRRNKSEFAK